MCSSHNRISPDSQKWLLKQLQLDWLAKDQSSLKRVMEKFSLYEEVSGQKVNRRKSGFFISPKSTPVRRGIVFRITGFFLTGLFYFFF